MSKRLSLKEYYFFEIGKIYRTIDLNPTLDILVLRKDSINGLTALNLNDNYALTKGKKIGISLNLIKTTGFKDVTSEYTEEYIKSIIILYS